MRNSDLVDSLHSTFTCLGLIKKQDTHSFEIFGLFIAIFNITTTLYIVSMLSAKNLISSPLKLEVHLVLINFIPAEIQTLILNKLQLLNAFIPVSKNDSLIIFYHFNSYFYNLRLLIHEHLLHFLNIWSFTKVCKVEQWIKIFLGHIPLLSQKFFMAHKIYLSSGLPISFETSFHFRLKKLITIKKRLELPVRDFSPVK